MDRSTARLCFQIPRTSLLTFFPRQLKMTFPRPHITKALLTMRDYSFPQEVENSFLCIHSTNIHTLNIQRGTRWTKMNRIRLPWVAQNQYTERRFLSLWVSVFKHKPTLICVQEEEAWTRATYSLKNHCSKIVSPGTRPQSLKFHPKFSPWEMEGGWCDTQTDLSVLRQC